MRLRTANHHRRVAHRKAVLKAAFDFDMQQCSRQMTPAHLRRRANSYYVRRSNKAHKLRMRNRG